MTSMHEPERGPSESDENHDLSSESFPKKLWVPKQPTLPNGEVVTRTLASGEDVVESALTYTIRAHVESTFIEIGIAETRLYDFVTDLYERFIRFDNIWPSKSVRGQEVRSITSILELAGAERNPKQEFVLRKSVGDITLFYIGFCEAERLRGVTTDGRDTLIDYREMGKRSYIDAADLLSDCPDADALGDPDVLEMAGNTYDKLASGLREVKKSFEVP